MRPLESRAMFHASWGISHREQSDDGAHADWFISTLEDAGKKGRRELSIETALGMINDKLSAFEQTRLLACHDERMKRERDADGFLAIVPKEHAA